MKWSINMVLCAAPCDKEATSTCWQRREKYLKAFGKSESSDSGGRRQNQQAKGKEECLEQTTVYVILWAAVFWDESTTDLLYYSSLYWNSSKWTMSTQFPDSRAGIRHCWQQRCHFPPLPRRRSAPPSPPLPLWSPSSAWYRSWLDPFQQGHPALNWRGEKRLGGSWRK